MTGDLLVNQFVVNEYCCAVCCTPSRIGCNCQPKPTTQPKHTNSSATMNTANMIDSLSNDSVILLAQLLRSNQAEKLTVNTQPHRAKTGNRFIDELEAKRLAYFAAKPVEPTANEGGERLVVNAIDWDEWSRSGEDLRK